MKEYYSCRVCGRQVAARANGTYWNHTNGIKAGGGTSVFSERCSGSGDPIPGFVPPREALGITEETEDAA